MNAVARLAAAASLALAASGARAVSIDADTWTAFDFYDDIASAAWVDLDLAPVSFEFVLTGPAVLRIVDGGLAGDRFEVRANGAVLGTTSAAAAVRATSPEATIRRRRVVDRWVRVIRLSPAHRARNPAGRMATLSLRNRNSQRTCDHFVIRLQHLDTATWAFGHTASTSSRHTMTAR